MYIDNIRVYDDLKHKHIFGPFCTGFFSFIVSSMFPKFFFFFSVFVGLIEIVLVDLNY